MVMQQHSLLLMNLIITSQLRMMKGRILMFIVKFIEKSRQYNLNGVNN